MDTPDKLPPKYVIILNLKETAAIYGVEGAMVADTIEMLKETVANSDNPSYRASRQHIIDELTEKVLSVAQQKAREWDRIAEDYSSN
jgi:hypothetical protein